MTPLEGLTVLDFTRVLSGPYCTMQLGDLGARVIKIEQPGRGDDTRAWGPPFVNGESAYFLSINRNKESVALDLKDAASTAIVEALLARADVVVENFRPGTLDRLGWGYAAVAAHHPRIVYCAISGFGQTGPRRLEAGYDAMMQGEAGLMSITGPADGPPYRLGVAIADIATGMFAVQGILAALYAREKTGRGQLVDIAMLDSVTALLTYQASIAFATGGTPTRMGNRHPSIAPYDTFPAADGEFVLSVGNDDQFARLSRVIGRPELAGDSRFATNADRVRHYDMLRRELTQGFSSWKRADVLKALSDVGVPASAVRSVTEALADPQVAAREMIVPLEHVAAGPIRVLGTPLKFSDTPAAIRKPPPALGQHTAAVLREFGLNVR
jgi:crotonobetainyl-CoA:carnitine CoA-transferase CaiB-like acyl-CoA transferase